MLSIRKDRHTCVYRTAPQDASSLGVPPQERRHSLNNSLRPSRQHPKIPPLVLYKVVSSTSQDMHIYTRSGTCSSFLCAILIFLALFSARNNSLRIFSGPTLPTGRKCFSLSAGGAQTFRRPVPGPLPPSPRRLPRPSCSGPLPRDLGSDRGHGPWARNLRPEPGCGWCE